VPATHTDKAFEQDLRDLREKLLAMGAKVEAHIASSVRALTERDTPLAEKVVQSDKDVNRLEIEIDDLCRRILALRQPAASDLRLITTALKIVTDLERIGDLAVNIAGCAIDLSHDAEPARMQDLARLAALCLGQVRLALAAFNTGDVHRAQQIIRNDEGVDARYHAFFNELIAFMIEDPRHIRSGNGMLFIAKHLERIADHAVNVAEMVIFLVRGRDVRHPRSRGLV
jgi:phosphate transport system protein